MWLFNTFNKWRHFSSRINRSDFFLLLLIVAFLIPLAIPNVGIDYVYFFIMVLVLAAWFSVKWSRVKSLSTKGSKLEITLGGAVIIIDYAQNAFFHSRLGLVDMLVIFSSIVVVFYGFRAFRLFWVPAAYGMILLLGYQIENNLPNIMALQDWLARLMASSVQVLGISATISQHLVTLYTVDGPVVLSVDRECTGIQGILAFGLLSTMALLDLKPRMSRLVPLFVMGFLGSFLVNVIRLFVIFLTFQYFGTSVGEAIHVYVGYTLFIAWVLVFWSFAFRYLVQKPGSMSLTTASVSPTVKPLP